METIENALGTLRKISNTSTEIDEYCRQAVEIVYDSNDLFDWVGIYFVRDQELYLPSTSYKGLEPEHKVIPFSKGICGAAATERATILVDDVNSDPRYLSCSIYTKSEIVIPLINNKQLVGVLDIDSNTPAAFHSNIKTELEEMASIIAVSLAEYH